MPAPRGNQNAAKGRMWAAAIERALDRRKTGKDRIKAIDELADKLLDLCLEGNLSALQEFGNRMDGKPHQSMDVAYTEVPTEELGDSELERIAAGGRAGAANAKKGKAKSSSVH